MKTSDLMKYWQEYESAGGWENLLTEEEMLYIERENQFFQDWQRCQDQIEFANEVAPWEW